MSTIPQRLREIAKELQSEVLSPRSWARADKLIEVAAELEAPAADAVPWYGEFIRATNDAYIAWCATHYRPEALDERGMMSLHGLWAWQEQERRTRATVAALQAQLSAVAQAAGDAEASALATVNRLHAEAATLQSRINALEARQVPSGEAIEDVVRAGLSLTFHCTRVWSAWGVGTMSEDDFEPVDESDTPREIAESVLALLQPDTSREQP